MLSCFYNRNRGFIDELKVTQIDFGRNGSIFIMQIDLLVLVWVTLSECTSVCVYRCDITCHLILINQSKTAFEKTASHERSHPLQQEKEKSSIDAPHLINALIDVLTHPALIPREREQKESEEEMRPQWRSWSIIHPEHFSCPELEWIRQRVSIEIATASLITKPFQHIREEHGALKGRTWRQRWCLNSLWHGLNTAEWNIFLLLCRLSCWDSSNTRNVINLQSQLEIQQMS